MEDLATSADKDFSAQFLQNRKKRRQRRIVAFLAVVAAVGGYYYWTSQQVEQGPADETLIVEIGYGNIENAIPAAGTLQPREIVPIGARASGELEDIFVEVGDYVEEGQALARIDAQEQRLRVERSELSLQNQRNQIPQRETDVRLAKLNLERTLALYAADASTEQEKENAEKNAQNADISLENLKIQIQQSEKDLEQERVQLDYTEIKAPMSGTIITLDQKEGATLNASQTAPTVMQIADLTTLMVEVEISEADMSQIDIGTDVYFTTLGNGNRRWESKLRQILPMPQTSNNVVLFTGRFDVSNEDGALFPGMTTQVFFVTSRAENVLTVPLGALTFVGDENGGQNGGPNGGAQMTGRQGGQGMPNGGSLAAARNGEMTPEMREQFAQRRGGGGFDGGSFAGGGRGGRGGRGGGGAGGFAGARGGGSAGAAGIGGSIPVNLPRAATVQVVQEDGSFVTREVVVGATDRVNAQVISGLEAGERVVAGVIQARVEDDDDDDNRRNNNNNSWGRNDPRRMFF